MKRPNSRYEFKFGGNRAWLCALLFLARPGLAIAHQPNALDRLLSPGPAANTFWTVVTPPLSAQTMEVHPVQSEFENEDGDRNKVSVARAVGLSLLLPGTGQWSMGAQRRGGVFLGTEALTWAAFTYFKSAQSAKEDDSRLQALTHAGAQPEGKDEDYYRALTFYESRELYNEEGRLLGGDRPYYPDDPEWDWQWDTDASRDRYRQLRNQSNEAESRSRFTLGAALANRLVAAVDAWRTARAINRQARMETAQWKVRLKGRPNLNNPGASVIFSLKF